MIKRLQAAARKEVLPIPGAGKEDLDDPQNLLVEGIISRTEANEVAERKQKVQTLFSNQIKLIMVCQPKTVRFLKVSHSWNQKPAGSCMGLVGGIL